MRTRVASSFIDIDPMTMMRGVLAAAFCVAVSSYGEVRQLNEATFDAVVDGSVNVLVEFYKPDCGHCMTMEPEFYATAEALEYDEDVILARVDTEESPKLGKRFEIDGHPIFRYFPKGGDNTGDKFYFVHYSGRMANTFLKMLGERTGTEYPKLELEVSKVRKFKAEEFDDVVLAPKLVSFVAMYTPWTESKPIIETLDGVAKIAHAEKAGVQVAKMGIERIFERDIADKYKCKGYPCYFLFPDDATADTVPVRYEGPDDEVEKVVEFINKHAGKTMDPRGTVRKAEIGRIKALDALLEEPDVLAKLEAAGANLPADQAIFLDYYTKAAVKAAETPNYVLDELARITNLLKNTGTLSAPKRKEFTARKNILNAFAIAEQNVKAKAAHAAHGGEL